MEEYDDTHNLIQCLFSQATDAIYLITSPLNPLGNFSHLLYRLI